MLALLTRQSVAGLRLLLLATLVLGLAYPLVVYGAGRLVPDRADGSFVTAAGQVVGSALIGQTFEGDGYFLSRPSAAGDGYDPLSTGASNLGPENADLLAAVEQRRNEVAEREGVRPLDVPVDAVTASGSGLDPHVSPAYAAIQVARVAQERGLAPAEVEDLVAEHTDGRDLGFLGEPRVNVLMLNLALDKVSR